MENDQREKNDVQLKEESNESTAEADHPRGDTPAGQFDTEFATETWMGAVFNPQMSAPLSSKRAYNPVPTATDRVEVTEPAVMPDQSGAGVGGEQKVDGHVGTETDRNDDTELAAEIAAPVRNYQLDREQQPDRPESKPKEDAEEGASGLGMVGLALSILSLFLLPYLLAPAGMVVGYLAYRRNARTMGIWSMVIGAIALLGAMLIYPYFTAR